MSNDQAERWVVISALVVAGVWAYRRLTEQPATAFSVKSAVGQGAPLAAGAFITSWGVVFLGVSVMAAASPPLGGAFAILIMTTDLLANTPALVGDVGKQSTAKTTPVQTAHQAGPGPQTPLAGQPSGSQVNAATGAH